MSKEIEGIIMVPANAPANQPELKSDDSIEPLQNRVYIVGEEPEEKAENKSEVDTQEAKTQEIRDLLKFGEKKKKTPKEEPKAAEVKEEPKPEETPAKAKAAKPAAAPAKESEEEDEDSKPRRRPRFHVEDVERAAEAAARGAIKASKEEAQAKPDASSEDQGESLDEQDSALLKVYQELEEANPKYKGQSKKFLKFVPAAKAYEAAWRRKHPGEEFNPDDAEHAEFYARNEPLQITEADEASAKRRLNKRETRDEIDSMLTERERAMEQRVAWKLSRKEAIPEESNKAVTELVHGMDPELADRLSKMNTREELDQFAEEDPASFEVINDFAADARSLVSAIVESEQPDSTVELDNRNPAHRHLASVLSSREDYVLSLPRSKQMWDDRAFVTNEQWVKLSDKDRKRHWTIDAQLLRKEVVKELSSVASEALKRERKKVERYRGKVSASKSTPAPVAEEEESPKPAAAKPRSPESRAGVGTTNSDGTKTGVVNQKKQDIKNLLFPE